MPKRRRETRTYTGTATYVIRNAGLTEEQKLKIVRLHHDPDIDVVERSIGTLARRFGVGHETIKRCLREANNS